MPGTVDLEPNVGRVLGEDDLEEEPESEAYFGLEFQLRDFLAQNLKAISVEGRRVRLYVDPSGRGWHRVLNRRWTYRHFGS